MMVSFCAVIFPRGVLDEILKLIESVSEGFPSYFYFTSTVITTLFDTKDLLLNRNLIWTRLKHKYWIILNSFFSQRITRDCQ